VKTTNRAARYLRIEPPRRARRDGEQLARSMQQLLDHAGSIFPSYLISNKSGGQENDGLGPDLDRIGIATIDGETFSLILEKTEDKTGAPVWLFSSQTIQRLPTQAQEIATPLVNRVLPAFLENNKWNGVPIGHWLAMLVLVATAYLFAWLIMRLVLYLVPLAWKKARTEPTSGIIRAFSLPLQLYLAVWIFFIASQQVGISIIVRQRFSQVTLIVGLVAVLLLVWQLISTITDFAQKQLVRRNNMAGVSALLFFRRAAQVALIVMGALIIFSSFGWDVTTGLAALGIGGIALALGAQKTIENFVGSVTLIADQPVRVGDFCKIGDIVGTVEQIGIRSTRIRTLSRTIITVPNGELSSLKIENYAHRDRFWFHPIFGIRFETTPDQIRFLLVELRSVLYAHPKVDANPARVRFIEIGSDCLKLEVFAYIHAADFEQFLEIQEDLLLCMMDIIGDSGTGFAFPSQTLYLAQDQGLSKEKTAEAEARLQQWRESGEMHMPGFNPEHGRELGNTKPYPPQDSSLHTSDNTREYNTKER